MIRLRVVHIITGLGDGGAENTLYKVCKNDFKNQHIVISLTNLGKYRSLIKNLGVKVYNIDLKFYSILKFFFLIKLIRSLKPNIIQTWLIMGDLVGGIAGRLAGIKNILSKQLGSNNLLNNARATINGLSTLRSYSN